MNSVQKELRKRRRTTHTWEKVSPDNTAKLPRVKTVCRYTLMTKLLVAIEKISCSQIFGIFYRCMDYKVKEILAQYVVSNYCLLSKNFPSEVDQRA